MMGGREGGKKERREEGGRKEGGRREGKREGGRKEGKERREREEGGKEERQDRGRKERERREGRKEGGRKIILFKRTTPHRPRPADELRGVRGCRGMHNAGTETEKEGGAH